jgi:hypothetical protein
MNYKKFWMGLFTGFIVVSAWAQEPVVPRQEPLTSPYQRYTTYQVTFRYGAVQPLSGLSDYVGDLGTRNYSLAGEWVRPNDWSFGVQYSDNYFRKRMPRQVYQTTSGADISAVQTRTFSVQSLLATGKYHFADVTSVVRPYVGAGAGIAFADYTYYLGSLEGDSQRKFKFAGQLAIGSRFSFGRESHWGADVQLNYQYLPFSYNEVSNASTAGGWIGIFYRWW